MRIQTLLRRLAVWLLCRLPFPVVLAGPFGRPFTLIRGRVLPPMAGADDGDDDEGDDDKDAAGDKDADADKDDAGDDADDDKDGDADKDGDDDDEDKLPDNVKAILKKERDLRRKAERDARKLRRDAKKPDPKPAPKKGDADGDGKDGEADLTTARFRRANLRAALAEEGLSKDLAKAAIKLIDIDDIDFDDDDEPTNLEDILEEARETYPFLKGEKPKPKAKAPDSNDSDGTGEQPKSKLTAEELAMAKAFGMTAEEYTNFKALDPKLPEPKSK